MSEQQKDEKQGGRFAGVGAAVSGFVGEVGAEFHRITWPKGRELVDSTLVVLAFIVILSATVLVFDKAITWALKLVIGA